MIVVADTSSLNYLVLIQHIDLLPRLYGRIVIPRAVYKELTATKTPIAVKLWIESQPPWVDVCDVTTLDASISYLGAGERDGIALAQDLGADLLILDDLAARRVAEARNITVIGILGILRDAHREGWIDLGEATERLKGTGFRATTQLIASLLEQNKK